MKPLLMLLHRDELGAVKEVPFVYRNGTLVELIEGIADYIVVHGLECATWEAIAADRLRIVMEQDQLLKTARDLLETQKGLIEKLKAEVIPGALAQ